MAQIEKNYKGRAYANYLFFAGVVLLFSSCITTKKFELYQSEVSKSMSELKKDMALGLDSLNNRLQNEQIEQKRAKQTIDNLNNRIIDLNSEISNLKKENQVILQKITDLIQIAKRHDFTPEEAEKVYFISREYLRIKQATPKEQFVERSNASSPYSMGIVKSDVLQLAVDNVNLARYIAGVPNTVKLDNDLIKYVQSAAVTMDALNDLTHYPSQPSDMPQDFFDNAEEGAKSSNIASGPNLPESVWLYMEDSDPSNINVVGHRRWVLSPIMGKTAFGLSGRYSAMYVFDKSENYKPEKGYIAWPCDLFPINEMYNHLGWSFSFDARIYSISDINSLSVVLKRKSDNQTWVMMPGEDMANGQYCNVDSSGCGYGDKTIIFRPPYTNEINIYGKNDIFTVTIIGLSKPVQYTVKFFDVNDVNQY